MRILLDTCTFVWLCAEPARLSASASSLIHSSDADLLLGDVSALEIALKWAAGKLRLPTAPRLWIEDQLRIWKIESVPLSRDDMYRAAELPDLHRDPFDRLLVATAINRNAVILTPDSAVQRYPASWTW